MLYLYYYYYYITIIILERKQKVENKGCRAPQSISIEK